MSKSVALTPKEQLFLRVSLEKVSKAFFKQAERKKMKILKPSKAPVKEDAFALLAVLSHWAGDIIQGAPEHMKDNMFLAFADSVVEVAGIKAQEEKEAQTVQ